ncbi:MAG: SBBP repeat-containing protein [Planctomycetota bacterium]|jgi:hypothetical protein
MVRKQQSLWVIGGFLAVMGVLYLAFGRRPAPPERQAVVAGRSAEIEVLWARQLGSVEDDKATDVAIDSDGNCYVVGFTQGGLGGANLGEEDAFVAKYDSDGRQLWIRQFGTPRTDSIADVAVDSSDNCYVGGSTHGNLGGQNCGGADILLVKFSPDGQRLWIRQRGSANDDVITGLAVVDGQCIVSGFTLGSFFDTMAGKLDGFVASFDEAGSMQWARQFGSKGTTTVHGVAASSDGCSYVVGGVTSALPGQPEAGLGDAFVMGFDEQGNDRWTKQYCANVMDVARAVAVSDEGGCLVAGSICRRSNEASEGFLGRMNFDGYVTRFDSNGVPEWVVEYGDKGRPDRADGLACYAGGSCVVVGLTKGDVEGVNRGGSDGLMVWCDGQGIQRAAWQFGTTEDDKVMGVAIDQRGRCIIVGHTAGPLAGHAKGKSDAFVLCVNRRR